MSNQRVVNKTKRKIISFFFQIFKYIKIKKNNYRLLSFSDDRIAFQKNNLLKTFKCIVWHAF